MLSLLFMWCDGYAGRLYSWDGTFRSADVCIPDRRMPVPDCMDIYGVSPKPDAGYSVYFVSDIMGADSAGTFGLSAMYLFYKAEQGRRSG